MTDLSQPPCTGCAEPLERVRYFPRQLLTADDMRVEQEYFREKGRRHNRYLHGWGVVCGLSVQVVEDADTPTVRVCPGYAVGPQGDEILIDDCVDVDLKLGAKPEPCTVRWPCPPEGDMPGMVNGRTLVYIAVRYAECQTRPTRVHPAGCGCDESLCEYARVRESFEVKLLWKLPQSHIDARADDMQWCNLLQSVAPSELRQNHAFPVPPCPPCVSDPWVVLATVGVAEGGVVGGTSTPAVGISYKDRRVLLATQRLQTAMLCIP